MNTATTLLYGGNPGPSAAAAQAWDQAADGWNAHSTLIGAWLKDATTAMLDAAAIGPGQRVLDIAAGAGEQTLAIARRIGAHGRVLASDISPRILALAGDNARAAGLSQVTLHLADAQKLGLDGAGFDAAVSRLGLMFCPEPLQALQQARAALKPGGRFAALVFGMPERNPCLVTLMASARAHAGLPALVPGTAPAAGSLMSLGPPGLLEQLLRQAGFGEIEVRPLSAPFAAPSSAHYLDFVRSAAPPITQMLARLPVDQQRSAWRDMDAQLQRHVGASGFCGPNELLLCSASSAP